MFPCAVDRRSKDVFAYFRRARRSVLLAAVVVLETLAANESRFSYKPSSAVL